MILTDGADVIQKIDQLQVQSLGLQHLELRLRSGFHPRLPRRRRLFCLRSIDVSSRGLGC